MMDMDRAEAVAQTQFNRQMEQDDRIATAGQTNGQRAVGRPFRQKGGDMRRQCISWD